MQITFDATDPVALAAFWATALPGYEVAPPPPGFANWPEALTAWGIPQSEHGRAAALVGDGPRLFFQRVPEPKTAKNRIHLDLQSGGGPGVAPEEQRARVRAEVTRLEALGATSVEEHEELGVVWTVMLDPEGNEFCA